MLSKLHYVTLLFWGFTALCFSAYSQEASNKNTLIRNWQHFHNQGEYDKAIEQAESIYQLGKTTKDNELMAQALNWEAQSLLKKSGRANRRTAARLFKESLDLIATMDNKALQMDNWKQLREIARVEEDKKTYAIYDKLITEVENQIQTAESNRALSEKVEQLDQKVEQLGGTVELLGGEKVNLQKRVESLSAAQMKAELMLAMQRNYLDSLEMVRMLDAFDLEKNEMKLKDQATQLALQQNQLRLQASQRNLLIAIAAILMIMAVSVYLRFKETKKYNTVLNQKNEALYAEQQRSEQLLLNILPAMVAEELKKHGMTKARQYEQATVMFVDFKEFSRIAKVLTPEQLVNELDVYFKAFDAIISKYNIEKIKTIGDAYMCVGGLPDVEGSEPKDVVLAALEIQALMDKFKKEREQAGRPYFEARIGIHTGPLIAGVVGSMKFAYDVWGDTVNIAARLETNGQAWRVNISEATYNLVKDQFEFETRGIMPIKNNHDIGMYFVNQPANYISQLSLHNN
ncbi:MAG: adenylate/guanylate cyclase domain-containing protein [Saprospiraceae bacterium]